MSGASSGSCPIGSASNDEKHFFQFCFCKNLEENKIPYQKLLIQLDNFHYLLHSLLSVKNLTDSSQVFAEAELKKMFLIIG
jgi:hypothetical protein